MNSKEDRLSKQTVGRWKGTTSTARMATHCGQFPEGFTGSAS
jgi:hypothetical protein